MPASTMKMKSGPEWRSQSGIDLGFDPQLNPFRQEDKLRTSSPSSSFLPPVYSTRAQHMSINADVDNDDDYDDEQAQMKLFQTSFSPSLATAPTLASEDDTLTKTPSTVHRNSIDERDNSEEHQMIRTTLTEEEEEERSRSTKKKLKREKKEKKKKKKKAAKKAKKQTEGTKTNHRDEERTKLSQSVDRTQPSSTSYSASLGTRTTPIIFQMGSMAKSTSFKDASHRTASSNEIGPLDRGDSRTDLMNFGDDVSAMSMGGVSLDVELRAITMRHARKARAFGLEQPNDKFSFPFEVGGVGSKSGDVASGGLAASGTPNTPFDGSFPLFDPDFDGTQQGGRKGRSSSDQEETNNNRVQRGTRNRQLYQRASEPGAVAMESVPFGAPPLRRGRDIENDGRSVTIASQSLANRESEKTGQLEVPAAMAVSDEVVWAKPMPSTFKMILRDRRSRTLAFCILVAAFVATTATITALFFTRSNDVPAPVESTPDFELFPTMAPTNMPTVILTDYQTLFESISAVGKLYDPASPQYKAIFWMANFDKPSELELGPLKQRYVMALLFYALTQDSSEISTSFRDWLRPDLHECDWSDNIKCFMNGLGVRLVTGLDLGRHQLCGEVPDEIGDLPTLKSLSLRDNEIHGTLPDSIGKLQKMVHLDLERNELTGIIPSGIGNMQLTHLDLSHNSLSGDSIPTELMQLIELRIFDVSFNKLGGTFPFGMENLQLLRTINMRNNRFNGSVPIGSLSRMSELAFVHFDYNEFTGNVLDFLGILGKHEILTVSNNLFSGSLPTLRTDTNDPVLTNFMNSFRLRKTDTSNNLFTGSIPSLIGHLPALRTVLLAGNMFTGEFPDMNVSNVEKVDASHNLLTGIKMTKGDTLIHADFRHNKINMNFDGSILQFPKLAYLDVSYNEGLQGNLPQTYTQSLRYLRTEGCNMTGTLPRGLGSLHRLERLLLGFNSFEGPLPPFTSLQKMTQFSVCHNQLTGTIPEILATQMPDLEILELDHNLLVGSIPDDITELNDLLNFTVAGNPGLSGRVSEALCLRVVEHEEDPIPFIKVDCNGDVSCTCCKVVSEDGSTCHTWKHSKTDGNVFVHHRP